MIVFIKHRTNALNGFLLYTYSVEQRTGIPLSPLVYCVHYTRYRYDIWNAGPMLNKDRTSTTIYV